ncbi:MAG: hypothetical protein ACPGWM_09805, partial [Flavobacteriales bacterium]
FLLFNKWKALQIEGVSGTFFQVFFSLKVICGLALWWIYSYHYEFRDTSDAFRYFDDAMVMVEMLKNNPIDFFRFFFGVGLDQPDVQMYFDQMHGWTSSYSYGIINDNPLIIRLNALIGLFSLGSFHVHTIFMAFLSTIGAWLTSKGIALFSKYKAKVFIILLMLLPSYLFWSSSVLKEVPLLLGFGGMVYLLCKVSKNGFTIKHSMMLLFCSLSLLFVKGYVIMAFVPALIFFILDSKIKRPILSFSAVVLIAFLLAGSADVFYPAGNFYYVLGKKQVDFYNVALAQNAGSVIEIPAVSGFSSFVRNGPNFIINSYLRPFPFEGNGLLYLLCKFEIALMLVMIVAAVVTFRYQGKLQLRMILMSVLFMTLLGVIIGATVPILGAIVRYKVPALFILAFVLSFSMNEERWKKLIPFQ